MVHFNRDSIVAVLLLLASGVLFWASFDIREPDYGALMPSTWPRIIIIVLAVLSLVYLVQSLRAGPDEGVAQSASGRTPGLAGFIAYWRNPLICFAMFFAFLITLPVLGMLIGGVSFVFLLMNLLGGWEPKRLVIHAVVALATVGSMWSLFTFGLGVMLPAGEIFNPFAL